jgi:hypothetical protein
MKARVILALSLTVNFGLLGWLGLQLNHRSKPPPNPVVNGVARTLSLTGPAHSPPPADPAPLRPPEFRWSQIESEDYPAYITNLRTIGCPEKTIRDIILADLEKLYQSRLEASRQTNNAQFWNTAEQRGKERRELNRRERELNREKRAQVKTLLGLDYDQAALEAWWDEQEFALVLSFLPESKPVEVIATLNRFGEQDNEIDDRAAGILTPEDVALKKSFFNQMLAELGQQLTPSELEEVELRSIGAMSFLLDGPELAELRLTGVELREVMRLKWQWDSPLNEEFEWPDEAFEEKRRRGQEEFAVRARKLMGDDRFVGFLLQDDSEFQPIHELAERQNLSNSAALRAYEIMKETTDALTRARRDRTLSASTRRAQMEEIRQSAEQALRQTLGDGALADYLEQDAARWIVAPVKR